MNSHRTNRRLIAVLLIVLPSIALQAIEPPDFFSPFDQSTLPGVWEAILPYGDELVHIEIGKDKESFLALASNHSGTEGKFVYPLKSYSIAGSEVTLRFVQPNPGGGSVTIVGKGYAGDIVGGGIIIGTIQKGDHRIQEKRNPSTFDIFLRKGTWTRKLVHLSELAEAAIQQGKVAIAVETGNISNIPIYNQAILQGEWTDRAPSPQEVQKALNKIQLFLEHPGAVSSRQKTRIGEILGNRSPYHAQFIGSNRSSKQIILCNFFVNRPGPNGKDMFSNWKEKKVDALGHASRDFWQIEYDPERDQCFNFSSK